MSQSGVVLGGPGHVVTLQLLEAGFSKMATDRLRDLYFINTHFTKACE